LGHRAASTECGEEGNSRAGSAGAEIEARARARARAREQGARAGAAPENLVHVRRMKSLAYCLLFNSQTRAFPGHTSASSTSRAWRPPGSCRSPTSLITPLLELQENDLLFILSSPRLEWPHLWFPAFSASGRPLGPCPVFCGLPHTQPLNFNLTGPHTVAQCSTMQHTAARLQHHTS
jgi:hypothetical protein